MYDIDECNNKQHGVLTVMAI